MIKIVCKGASARAAINGVLTAGAVGIPIQFYFDEEWDGLTKMGYAKAGDVAKALVIDDNLATVPWECLVAGKILEIGVSGVSDSRRITTVWAQVGTVRQSVADMQIVDIDPTPSQIETITGLAQEAKQEAKNAVQKVDTFVSGYEESVKDFQEAAENAAKELSQKAESAIENVQKAKQETIDSATEGKREIDSKVESALTSIQSAGQKVLADEAAMRKAAEDALSGAMEAATNASGNAQAAANFSSDANAASVQAGNLAEEAKKAKESAEEAAQNAKTAQEAAEAVETRINARADKMEQDFSSSVAEVQKSIEQATSLSETVTEETKKVSTAVTALSDTVTSSEIVCTATGKELQITDGAERQIRGLAVFAGGKRQVQTTGKNLCSSELESGSFHIDSGVTRYDNTRVRTKDFIPLLAGTYTISYSDATQIVVYVYDMDNTYIRSESFVAWRKGNFVITLTDSRQIKFALSYSDGRDISGTADDFTAQIEKGSTVTAYEPYTGGKPSPSPEYPQAIPKVENPVVTVTDGGSQLQTVPVPLTGYGIPVSSGGNYTDADGQQWICDELRVRADGSGVVVRRIGRLDLRNSRVARNKVNENQYLISNTDILKITDFDNTLRSRVLAPIHSDTLQNVIWYYAGARIVINAPPNVDTEVAFVDWLNNLPDTNVWFPQRVATTEELTPDQVQALLALRTYKPTTVITNDQGAGMEVSYVADPKNYIDNKFAELQALILDK